MSDVNSWSTTASSNNSASPDGFPENMPFAGVNNSARENMAAIAKWYGDTNGSLTTTGSSNTYVLSANRTVAAYANGLEFVFKTNFANTGAATLNVDSVGAANITTADGSALASGDMENAKWYRVIYQGSAFILMGHTSDISGSFIANVVEDVTPQLGGNLDGQDNEAQKVNLKDYGEVVNAVGSIGGGTQDIDVESGNVVTGTVDTSTTTFTFSNPSASGTACSFTLLLTNGGSQTVNWPSSVDWQDGVSPTLTSSGLDVLSFLTVDGGTIWHGFTGSLDSK